MSIVAFDMYGTLLDIELDEERPEAYLFLSQWLSYHGLTVAPQRLREQYKTLCHQEISSVTNQHPDIDIGRVFTGIIEGLKESTQKPTPCMVENFARLFRMLTTTRLSPYPGVKVMLKTLSQKTRLGIISNSQRLFTMPELSRFGLLEFFEEIVFSSDVNACKPNPLIFQSFLHAMKTQPRDVVFIGDSLNDDVRGAGNVGIRTIWINRSGGSSLPGQIAIKPDIENGGFESGRLTQRILGMLSR